MKSKAFSAYQRSLLLPKVVAKLNSETSTNYLSENLKLNMDCDIIWNAADIESDNTWKLEEKILKNM